MMMENSIMTPNQVTYIEQRKVEIMQRKSGCCKILLCNVYLSCVIMLYYEFMNLCNHVMILS